MISAVLALGSALSFGVGDFLGGLASRRLHPFVVTFLAQASGGLVALAVVPLLGGELSVAALGTGAVAGIAGVVGLAAYFHALSTGPMGVTAPVAAVAGAVVPVAVGLAAGERPGAPAFAGMLLGVLAAVLVSLPDGVDVAVTAAVRRAAAWALLGGVAFGMFFVALDLTPDGSGLWPLVGARLASVPLIGAVVLLTRTHARPGATRPARPWQLGVLSGVLDMTANALFLMATRTGLLSITSVLASLYPAVVAVLAAIVLRERLGRTQRRGVVAALTAVVLLAV